MITPVPRIEEYSAWNIRKDKRTVNVAAREWCDAREERECPAAIDSSNDVM